MGRRSRKRGRFSAPADDRPAVAAQPARRPQRPAARRAHLDEAPRPPWHPFPLTEIGILVALVVLGAAFLSGGGGGPRAELVVFGLAVLVLATGELALREHLAGYRSHSLLLGGLAAVAVAAPFALLARPARWLVLVVAAVVLLLVAQVLRDLFRRRSGG
jgi:hypothetical protein